MRAGRRTGLVLALVAVVGLAGCIGFSPWRARAPAPMARFESLSATVGRKLYVLGGFDRPSGTATRQSYVYDPVTDRWARTPDLPTPVTHAPAVVVDGAVWLMGGFVGNYPGVISAAVWRFDTVAQSWSRGPDLPAPRGAGAAAIVGRFIHFFGGVYRPSVSVPFQDYGDHWSLNLDNIGAGWKARAPLPTPRNHLGGTALRGMIYAIGGQLRAEEANGNRHEVHRYDPATNQWSRVADLPVSRSHITEATFEAAGTIVVVGGSVNGGHPTDEVTVYEPGKGWQERARLPAARSAMVATSIGGLMIASTGRNGDFISNATVVAPLDGLD